MAFGPSGQTQEVAIVEDRGTGTWFSLVPGGTLHPGLSEGGLAAFWDLENAWLTVLSARTAHEQPYTAKGWSPEQLHRRPPVEVPPMFVALQPLPARVLEVEAGRFASRPLLRFEEAESIAARLGYAVPTSDELEWSTKADGDGLFVWGDDLPSPMDPREPGPSDRDAWEDEADAFASAYMELAAEAIAPWPTSGLFGLQGAGGQPVWCRGPHGEALVAGGAGRFFPWQGCGEWLWLLPSIRVEADAIQRHQGAMLRPILRIVERDAPR